MANRNPASFAKRQREASKRAKRQEKAEKRAARRAERQAAEADAPLQDADRSPSADGAGHDAPPGAASEGGAKRSREASPVAG